MTSYTLRCSPSRKKGIPEGSFTVEAKSLASAKHKLETKLGYQIRITDVTVNGYY